MDTYEAKILLYDSLCCLARMMEQIRIRECEKAMGNDEPMQDHLALCVAGSIPYDGMSVKGLCNYLQRLYNGFKEASDHEILADRKFELSDYEIPHVCDMIMGFIGHGFHDDLVACAREVYAIARELVDPYERRMKSEKDFKKVMMEFFNRVIPITKKYGYDISGEKGYSVPIGYLQSWLKHMYWSK
jgi:hypothetical protein